MLRHVTCRALIALFLLAGTVALASAQGPVASDAEPWWGWVLLGRTHPFIVHFPIGLLIAGTLVELAQRLRGRRVPTDIGMFCLTAGLVAGALAVWVGTLNASHQSITGESADVLGRHQAAAWAVLAAGAAAWLTGHAARRGTSWAAPAYLGLVAVMGGAVGATGHFGGQLVYGTTYVTSVLPWNRSAQAPASSMSQPAADVPVSDAAGEQAPGQASADPASTASPADVPTRASVDLPPDRSDAPTARAANPPADTSADEAPSRPADPPAGRAESESPGRPAASPPDPSTAEASSQPSAAPASQPAVVPASQPVDEPASMPVATAVVGGSVSFSRDVMPLLQATCVECHGPDKVKARLRMDSVAALQAGGKSGALVEAGNPEQSLMLRRVQGLDGEDQMPLDADPLTPAQIDMLRRWIAEGARFDVSAPLPVNER